MKSLFHILSFSLIVVSSHAFELDQHAKVIESPLPIYPSPGPYEAGAGVVSVVFAIDAKGEAKIVRIMNSSSYRFSEAGRLAASRWKFSAGKRDGKPSTDVLEYIFLFSPGKTVEIIGPLYESY